MTIEKIKESYQKLVESFKDAGLTLTESQETSTTSFIDNLENTIKEAKEEAAKEATAKFDAECKEVLEDIEKQQAIHTELTNKIQDKVAEINNVAKNADMVDAVNAFIDECIENSLPKQLVVDYKRMKKLSNLFESFKGMLAVSDIAVENEVKKVEESFNTTKEQLNSKITELESQLNESVQKESNLQKKIEEQAKRLDEQKIKIIVSKASEDLTPHETEVLEGRLAGLTSEEVEAKLPEIIKEIQKLEKTNQADDGERVKSLDEEIVGIIGNGPKSLVKEKQNVGGDKTSTEDKQDSDGVIDPYSNDVEDDEDLDESEMIDENIMKEWIRLTEAIDPIR